MQITLVDTFIHIYDSRQEKAKKSDASLRVATFDPLTVRDGAVCICPVVAKGIIEGLRHIEAIYYDPRKNSIFLAYFLPEFKYCFLFAEDRTYFYPFDFILENKNSDWSLLDTTSHNLHIRNLEMKDEHFPFITVTSLIPKDKNAQTS